MNSNFVNSKNIMRWKLQLSYNVISFSLILYFLANKLAKEDIKSDDIQHSKDIKSFAISIGSKITDIENSILQAKNNIDEIKKRQHVNYDHSSKQSTPHIYVITPTYVRWTQKAELTRIGHSLAVSGVPIHWIIVEDTDRGYPADVLVNFQKRYNSWVDNLSVTLLTAQTDPKFKLQPDDPNWLFPRGAAQRNRGLDFITTLNFGDLPEHLRNESAVVYFADDDNTYDHQLFVELTKLPKTHSIGVLPVGIVGGLAWEGPICKNGKVVKFHTAWVPNRPFPLDMAGFVVQLNEVKLSQARFSYHTRRGFLETDFLLKLVGTPMNAEGMSYEEYMRYLVRLKVGALEKTIGLVDDCSKVLVWHTRTEKPKNKDELKLRKAGNGSPDMEI